jgi:hypothetical protein
MYSCENGKMNLLNYSKSGKGGIKENDGGGEFNCVIL